MGLTLGRRSPPASAYFEQWGRELFESLWRLDILAMALNPSPS
jgi:hypothetical protein